MDRGARPGSARARCSPRRGGAPASPAPTCWPRAGPSSSASSRSASCGSCSRSVVADPERRERAARRAPPRPRRPCSARSDGDGDASFAALHGLFWVALNLAAERPLVLAIDDLHWCDRPSLRFVAYLARRLEGQPILVGATVRTGEQGTDVALLGEIAHDPSTVAVRPVPLSAEAVRDARPRAARRGRRGAVLRGVPPGDRRQPAVPAPAADGARGRPRAPGRRARGRGAGDRPARGVAHRARAARAAVRGRDRGRPRGRRARRERDAARRSPTLTGLTEARVADATGALARAEILRRETPLGVRARAGPRRGLPGAAARRARAAARARRARAARRGRAGRAGRGAPARRAAARPGVGRRAAARGGPRRRRARRAGERRRAAAAGARGARAGRLAARSC